MLWVPGINFSSLKIYSVIATSRPDSIGRTHEKSCALVTGQRVSFKFWNMTRARTRRGGSLLPVLFNETLHARWRSAWCTVHLFWKDSFRSFQQVLLAIECFSILPIGESEERRMKTFSVEETLIILPKKCLDHFFEGSCRSLAFDWWGTGEGILCKLVKTSRVATTECISMEDTFLKCFMLMHFAIDFFQFPMDSNGVSMERRLLMASTTKDACSCLKMHFEVDKCSLQCLSAILSIWVSL